LQRAHDRGDPLPGLLNRRIQEHLDRPVRVRRRQAAVKVSPYIEALRWNEGLLGERSFFNPVEPKHPDACPKVTPAHRVPPAAAIRDPVGIDGADSLPAA